MPEGLLSRRASMRMTFGSSSWTCGTRERGLRFHGQGAEWVRMGRAWTPADEDRLRSVECAATPALTETDVDDLFFRDVLAGTVVHLVAVLLYRLRIAAPPARSLSQAISAARDARTFWEWLAEPMVDLPEQFEATAQIDR